jgi:23S rRNA (adenine-N6)-dimethyltransferase
VPVRRHPSREASGRHFLRSRQLAADLVDQAEVGVGDLVLDLGAGAGVLTAALARAGSDVVAVERDAALVAELRRRFAHEPAVTVVAADVLDWPWPSEPFAVVSNLPFARSGAILSRLLRDPRTPLRRADVIVQWEAAAKRAAVWPGTLRSTYWSAWYELAVTRRLARTAFAPPPSVSAGVLRIVRRPRALVPPERSEEYWRFLSGAFEEAQPLARSLRGQATRGRLKRLAQAHGLDPYERPRDVDPRQWAALFRALRSG